jgi:hypothetical protein
LLLFVRGFCGFSGMSLEKGKERMCVTNRDCPSCHLTTSLSVCVCVCVRACVHACVHACVRACVSECM